MYFVLFGESVEGKEQPTVTTFFSTGWPLPFSPLFFFFIGPFFSLLQLPATEPVDDVDGFGTCRHLSCRRFLECFFPLSLSRDCPLLSLEFLVRLVFDRGK